MLPNLPVPGCPLKKASPSEGLRQAAPAWSGVAYRMGYITKEQVLELAQPLKKNEYGQYLLRLIGEA